MGIKFRETRRSILEWSYRLLIEEKFEKERQKHNGHTGMAQLLHKRTISWKASGVFHEALWLRAGGAVGIMGIHCGQKPLRMHLRYVLQVAYLFPEMPSISWASISWQSLCQNIPNSEQKGFGSRQPRTFLSFHNWGNSGQERKDLPKANGGRRHSNLGPWSQIQRPLSWSTAPAHHLQCVGSIGHSVLYKALSSHTLSFQQPEGGRVLPSPSQGGETEAQASDGHVANPCRSGDRKSNGMILCLGPLGLSLPSPPLHTPAWPRRWRTGARAPKPPCRCSAEGLREKQMARSPEHQKMGHETGPLWRCHGTP